MPSLLQLPNFPQPPNSIHEEGAPATPHPPTGNLAAAPRPSSLSALKHQLESQVIRLHHPLPVLLEEFGSWCIVILPNTTPSFCPHLPRPCCQNSLTILLQWACLPPTSVIQSCAHLLDIITTHNFKLSIIWSSSAPLSIFPDQHYPVPNNFLAPRNLHLRSYLIWPQPTSLIHWLPTLSLSPTAFWPCWLFWNPSNILSPFLPQGLCICSLLCLDDPSTGDPQGSSFTSSKSLFKSTLPMRLYNLFI